MLQAGRRKPGVGTLMQQLKLCGEVIAKTGKLLPDQFAGDSRLGGFRSPATTVLD